MSVLVDIILSKAH